MVLLRSALGVTIPALIGPSHQCACNVFHHDSFGDHLQTYQVKSSTSQVYDWVVYRLGVILGSVGHKVKKHKITPATGKERGDLEITDYVVLYLNITRLSEEGGPLVSCLWTAGPLVSCLSDQVSCLRCDHDTQY
jgi:hypothetical protein